MLETYLQDSLKLRLILFTGKGGVGKSAVAWATALMLQRAGQEVTLLSWNPFDKAADAQGYHVPGIERVQLSALECFKEYALHILKFERIYDAVFENKVLKTFVQAAPGLSETIVAGKIWQLFDSDRKGVLIVDLPASGHAFSFFQSPLGVQKLFSIGFVHKEATKIAEMFKNPRTRLDFVAIPEEMSLTETTEFYGKLKAMHPFSFGYLHLNQCTPEFKCPEAEIIKSLPPDVTLAVERFKIQLQAESEAIGTLRDLPFPRLIIPKFGTESAGTTIEKISEVLGKV